MQNTLGSSSIEYQKKTYTVEEVALQLRICKKTAYKLIQSNQFHYRKTGRVIRISKLSFDKWLNEQI